ncbi:hypothetical protein V7S43_018466 [Phytophthora oleae]|uniref:Uncharacterized protein n=1 Tax=Phytophthora oleae TaxID=2107226 RepID=A0ABD3ER73_9STRA
MQIYISLPHSCDSSMLRRSEIEGVTDLQLNDVANAHVVRLQKAASRLNQLRPGTSMLSCTS